MKTMLILPFIFLLMMITTLTSCESCTSRGEDHYDTTLVDTMKAIVLDSAKDTIWCLPHTLSHVGRTVGENLYL